MPDSQGPSAPAGAAARTATASSHAITGTRRTSRRRRDRSAGQACAARAPQTETMKPTGERATLAPRRSRRRASTASPPKHGTSQRPYTQQRMSLLGITPWSLSPCPRAPSRTAPGIKSPALSPRLAGAAAPGTWVRPCGTCRSLWSRSVRPGRARLPRPLAAGRWPLARAAGPLGRWALAAGLGRWPLGRWAAGPGAAGPLGRWALGRWAAGPLGRWASIHRRCGGRCQARMLGLRLVPARQNEETRRTVLSSAWTSVAQERPRAAPGSACAVTFLEAGRRIGCFCADWGGFGL